MSFRNKSDVRNHLGVSRGYSSLLTMTQSSEPDATGNSLAEDHAMVERDDLTEASAIRVEKSKTLSIFPQTTERE